MAAGKKGYSVGQAHILVRPNLDNFRKKLKAGVKTQSQGVNAQVGVDVDDRNLELFEKRVENTRLKLDVKPEINWDRFWLDVKAGLKAAEDNINVDVRANTAKARQEIASLKKSTKTNVDIGMSTVAAQSKLDTLSRDRIAQVRVALTGYTEAEAKLNRLSRFRNIGVNIHPERGFMDDLRRYETVATKLSLTNQAQFEGTLAYLTRPRTIPVTTKYVGESADAQFGIMGTQSVRVRLRPDFRQFKRDLEAWTKQNRPEMTITVRARTAAAAEKIRRLTRDETKTVHVNVRKDQVLAAAKQLENRMDSLVGAAGRAVTGGMKLSLIGLAAAGAIPEVAALSSEIGNIGKITAIAPAVINSFGAIAAAAAVSLGGLFGKDSPWQNYMDALKAEDDKKIPEGISDMDKALWGMGENTKQTIKILGDLRDEYQQLQNAGREALAKGLGEEVKKLTDYYLPSLKEHVAGFNSDFNQMFMQWSRFRRTTQGLDDFNTQMRNAAGFMQSFTKAVGYFGLAWNDLATVGSMFMPRMGFWASENARKFAEWTATNRENGELFRSMERGLEAVGRVGSIAGKSFSILGDVFRASAKESGHLVENMERSLEATKKWTSSEAGQNRMAQFFADATRTGDELMKTFGEIAKVFANTMAPLTADFMKGLGEPLRQTIRIVGSMLDVLRPSAESAGRALGNLFIGMHAWGIWITPIAREVLPSLVKAFEKLAPAIGALAGPVASLMVVKSLADKFTPFLTALDALAGKKYGGVAIRLSLITGAVIALATAFEPVADLVGGVAKVFTSFNNALGGVPLKIVAIATAVGMLRSAFKSMGSGLRELEGSGSPGGRFLGSLGIAKKFDAATEAVRRTTQVMPALRREYASVTSEIDRASKRLDALNEAQKNFGRGAATANKGFQRTYFNDMKREADSLTTHLSGLVDRQSQLYTTLGGRTKLTVGGMMRDTVSLVGSGMSKAAGAVKAGMSGLVGALGGWWSVGVIAAGTAITSIVQSHQNWNKYLRESEQLTQNLRGSSDRMFRSIGDGASQLQAAAEQVKTFKSELSSFAQSNKIGITDQIGNLLTIDPEFAGQEGISAQFKSWKKFGDRKRDVEAAQGLVDEINKRGLSDEELARKLSGSKGAVDGFIDSFAPEQRDKLRQFGDEIRQVQEKTEALGPAGIKAATAIDKIAAAGRNGKADITEFTDALREMKGISLSAPEIAKRLTDNIKAISGSPEQYQGAKWSEKGFDPFANEGSASAAQAMNDLAHSMEQAVEAGQDVDDVLTKSGNAMDTLAAAAGVSREELQKTYNLTKEDIIINVNAPHAGKTFGELSEIRNQLKTLQEGQTELQVNANTDEALIALDVAGLKVKDYDKETGTATIDVSDEEARQKLDEMLWEISSFESRHPQVGLGIDTSQLDQGVLDAMNQLGIIDQATPEAVAGLNWSSLNDNQKLAMAALFNLDQENPTPVADADVQRVLAKMQAGIDRTKALNGERAEPKVDVKGAEESTSKIDAVKAALLSVPNVVTSTINVVRKVTSFFGKDDGDGHYRGGRIPKFASGGRLPLSGPGTETVDGIYGVADDGTPIARVNRGEWVINGRSSERYNGILAAINAGTFPDLPGYAKGGILDNVAKMFANAGGAVAGAVNQLKAPTAPQGGDPNNGGDIFGGITSAWDNVSSQMQTGWSDFVGLADSTWQTVKDDTSTLWNDTSTAVLDAWNTAETGLSDGFSRIVADTSSSFTNARDTMSRTFTEAANAIGGVTNGQVLPTFGNLRGALGQTVQSFATGATGIANQWSRVREAVAAPVRFAISSVFNDGIVGMWNSAKELLGTPTMNPYPLRFATGGHVQGPGGPTDDKIPALLSDGEYVINAKAVKAIGLKNLHALNSGDVSVSPTAYKSNLPDLMANDMTWNKIAARYASGGPVKGTKAWEQLKRGFDWARSLNGRPYVLGGDPVGGGGTDCSGYMSSIADRIQGGPGHRAWATMNFNNGGNAQQASGPQGFVKGLAAGFSVGVLNGGPAGGHTAGTIGGVEGIPATNVESGGSHGNVAFGGPAVGADHSQFPTRYHLPIIGGEFVSGGGGGVSMAALVAQAMAPGKKKIRDAVAAWGVRAGHVNLVPRAVADKIGGKAEAVMKKKADELGPISGGPGVDLSGVSGSTIAQVQEVFSRHGWTGKQWEDAKWIIGKESGFNTTATNPSSGAFGLFQFNPSSGTLQTYLPSRTSDPAKQADAGARYIKERYGSPSQARAFWETHGWYAKGGVLPGFSPGKDIFRIPAYAFSGGEAIMRPEFTKAMGGKMGIDALNTAAIQGKLKNISLKKKYDENGKPVEEQRVFTAAQWDGLRRSIERKSRARDWDGVADDLVLASEVLAEGAARVDWGALGRDVERKAVGEFWDGQRSDLTKLLGFDYEAIPLVKAGEDLKKAISDQNKASAREVEQLKKKREQDDKRLEQQAERDKERAERDKERAARERASAERKSVNAERKSAVKGGSLSKEEAKRQEAADKAMRDKQAAAEKAKRDREKAERDKEEAERRRKERAERAKLDAEYALMKNQAMGVPSLDGVERKAPEFKRKLRRNFGLDWNVVEPTIRRAVRDYGRTADGLRGMVPANLVARFTHGRLRFANGGLVPGVGGPKQDNVPIMASAGEFVVKHASTAVAKPLLAALNADPATAAAVNAAFMVGKTAMGARSDRAKPENRTVYEYHIHASNVDEGMRRAKMHERQSAAAMTPYR